MNTQFIRSSVESYRSGFSLEQDFYANQEVFDAEWKSIFQKHWLKTLKNKQHVMR